MKAYTDIVQSKKLAEILPLKSADMAWSPRANAFQEWYEAENTRIVTNYEKKNYIPCWSLVALLSVLPQSVRLVGTPKDTYWYCECVDSNNQWYAGFGSADNPVDACYEMIIKLHELNLL